MRLLVGEISVMCKFYCGEVYRNSEEVYKVWRKVIINKYLKLYKNFYFCKIGYKVVFDYLVMDNKDKMSLG